MCGIGAVKILKTVEADSLKLLAAGLVAINHRGQEGTGFAYFNGDMDTRVSWHKTPHLASAAYTELLVKHPGITSHLACGQVRYPTEGTGHSSRDLQPVIVETARGIQFALVLNGNQPRYDEIKKQMEVQGYSFTSNNEVELMARFLARKITEVDNWQANPQVVVNAITEAMKYFQGGAFSAVLMFQDNLYAFRDIHGFRPLELGFTDGMVCLFSETCALDRLSIPLQKRVTIGRGQIVHIDSTNQIRYYQGIVKSSLPGCRNCVFEEIYFAFPSSKIFSTNGDFVHDFRWQIGQLLAQQDEESNFIKEFRPDFVFAIPDSANSYAQGYARQSELFLNFPVLRNHYAGRTFICNTPEERLEVLRQKFSFLQHILHGQSIVVCDDSIVRGTTIKYFLFLLVECGVRAIHLRIGSPPIQHGCHWGINMEESDLVMAGSKNVKDLETELQNVICKRFHLENFTLTLRYLSLEKLFHLADNSTHCHHCFSGVNPLS